MPTYDYVCRKCGKQVTLNVKIHQRDYQTCCFEQMKRKPAAPAVQFKGPGWTPKGS